MLRAARGGLQALATALGLVFFGAGVGAQEISLEHAVKATYLYKFAPFVEWPAGAFASASSAVRLCIVGTDPFRGLLDEAVRGQMVDHRPIEVHHLPTARLGSGCHVMYVTGSPAQSAAEALRAVRGTPVLTVTDLPPGGGIRGIINFIVIDNRVHFAIDDQAAAINGLKISSKLLSLAVTVRPRSG